MITRIVSCFALPQSFPLFAYRGINIPLLCSYRGVSQGHSPTLVQAQVSVDFSTLAIKKCLEEFSRHTEPERRQISFHPSLWNMHQSSIETDTLQNQRGGLLAWGHSPDLPSQLSPMDHRSFVTFTAARTAADLHCVPFSLRSIQFFPFTGKTGSTR